MGINTMGADVAIVRTHHSYHEGSGVVKKYVAKAADAGIKNLIMADRTVMSDAINFYKACNSASINPVMGLLLSIFDEAEIMSSQYSMNAPIFKVVETLFTVCVAETFQKGDIASVFKDLETSFILPMMDKGFVKQKSNLSEVKKSTELLAAFLKVFKKEDLAKDILLMKDGISNSAFRAKLTGSTLFGESIEQIAPHPFYELYNLHLTDSLVCKQLGLSADCNVSHEETLSSIELIIPAYETFLISKKTKKKDTIEDFLKREYVPYKKVQEFSLLIADRKDISIKNLTDVIGAVKKLEKCTTGTKTAARELLYDIFSVPENKMLLNNLTKKDKEYIDLYLSEADSTLSLLNTVSTSSSDANALSAISEVYESYKYLVNNNFVSKITASDEHVCSKSYKALFLCLRSPVLFTQYIEKTEDIYPDITVFAKDQQGWKNLIMLSSTAFVNGQQPGMITLDGAKRAINSYPKITLKDLSSYKDGLCAVLGLEDDPIWKAIVNGQDVDAVVDKFKNIFGENIFFAIQHSNTSVDGNREILESKVNKHLISLSIKHSVIAFAANNAYYVNADDYDIHDAKSAELLGELANSKCRSMRFGHGNYLRTSSEMNDAFSGTPELLHNMRKLCDSLGINGNHLCIELDKPILPLFPIPDGYSQFEWMSHLATQGVEDKFGRRVKRLFGTISSNEIPEDRKLEYSTLRMEYFDRLDTELRIIDDMGFNGYFLIVAEFINWSKENGIPVGHGRGSGAGSIVAWGLDITDVDPIRYSLLFERFLNPERVSMPDFDVDFGSGFHPVTGEFMDRDAVIKHVQDSYNNPDNLFPSVGQIATHGLLSPKSAFKAFSRTTQKAVRYADELCKLVGDDPSQQKIKCCLENENILYRMNREPYIAELVRLATKAEGLKQNSGMHAGGVCIARGTLTDHTPIMIDIREPTKIVSQFDKYGVEEGGLVKFDFLGLFYLTIMEYAKKYIKDYRDIKIDLRDLCYEDDNVFALLKNGNSHGIFQVESEGMRKLLQRLLCDNMEELSALLALYRPGPLQSGMVDNFIARKHGKEEVSYPHSKYQHELLQPILEPTYGVILYQEQVMQIAQALAGYSLGEADMLRRAMGKKKPEEMEKQRSVFKEGAQSKGVDPDLAMKIFDLVEKFAGYGFNKSHSMAYAHITYQTAWFKTYYPTEYMCALLTSYSDNQDRLKPTLVDCKRNGITILPPDINNSHADFRPVKEGFISYGLSAIKGIGEDKLTPIIREREKNGAFKSVLDLKVRCPTHFTKSVAEGLRFSGALDNLETIKPLPDGALRPLSSVMGGTMTTRDIAEVQERLSLSQQEANKAIARGMEIKEAMVLLINNYNETTSFKTSIGDISLDCSNNIIFKEAGRLQSYITDLLNTTGLNEQIYRKHSANLNKIRSDMTERETLLVPMFKNASNEASVANKEVDSLISAQVDSLKNSSEVARFDKRAFLEKDCSCLDGSTKPPLQFLLENFDIIEKISKYGSFSEEIKQYIIDVKAGAGVDHDTEKKKYMDTCVRVYVHALLPKAMAVYESIKYNDVSRYADGFRLERECGYLTYFVTGHPFDVDNMRNLLLKHFKNIPITYIQAPQFYDEDLDDDLEIEKAQQKNRQIRRDTPQTRVAGIITSCRSFKVRKEGSKLQGRDMAAFTLDDSTAAMTIVVLPDAYDAVKQSIKNGMPFATEGQVFYDTYRDDGSISMLPDKIYNATNINEVLYANDRNRKSGGRR
ncbi:DNA polymerase III subunit alpha [Photobacterium kishitanii]|uniref:DNA polymerase III subunit alpha n=1 Tax=Photobacterium kishitanii TaxID=318456 RepID=A0A2T3KN46_9GAMM|nr:DNA polymerase III subunit alpha [Photobacterium kishitanii]PSV01165.1 hypothetical protein C9J27_03840 [Photobacterium kishitanii]